MRIFRRTATLACVVLIASACSGEGVVEQVLESQEGVGDVEIDADSGTFSIESEDGDTSVVVGGGEVPADFPIPLPPGGVVEAVLHQEGGTSVVIRFPIDEYEAIAGFYKNFVTSGGIEIVNTSSTSDPPLISWVLDAGADQYSVIVLNAGDATQVQLLVVDGG
jgi:hypothetical protein